MAVLRKNAKYKGYYNVLGNVVSNINARDVPQLTSFGRHVFFLIDLIISKNQRNYSLGAGENVINLQIA